MRHVARTAGVAAAFEAADAPAVRVLDLAVRYGPRRVLDGLDLEVRAGESAALMGSSGCGKSTLLSVVLGFAKPNLGEVWICGEPMKAGMSRMATKLRRELIGAVFQDGRLVDELTALENVELAGLLAGMPAGAETDRAEELLERLSLPAGSRPVASLSGGNASEWPSPGRSSTHRGWLAGLAGWQVALPVAVTGGVAAACYYLLPQGMTEDGGLADGYFDPSAGFAWSLAVVTAVAGLIAAANAFRALRRGASAWRPGAP